MRIIKMILAMCSIAAFGIFVVTEAIQFGKRDTSKPEITAETDMIEVTSEYTREDMIFSRRQ